MVNRTCNVHRSMLCICIMHISLLVVYFKFFVYFLFHFCWGAGGVRLIRKSKWVIIMLFMYSSIWCLILFVLLVCIYVQSNAMMDPSYSVSYVDIKTMLVYIDIFRWLLLSRRTILRRFIVSICWHFPSLCVSRFYFMQRVKGCSTCPGG